jgi:hypothetical protein
VVTHLNSGSLTVEIDPDDGGRLNSVTWLGMQLAAGRISDSWNWGWFPTSPCIDHKQVERHGFSVRQPWELVSADTSHCLLRSPTLAQCDGGEVIQRVEVGDGVMHWSVTFQGGNSPQHVWLGLQPWFRRRLSRGEPGEIGFTAETMMAVDEAGLLTGSEVAPRVRPWDHTFRIPRRTASIRWPGALRLSVESATPWWVIVDEDEKGLSIQPHSAPPEAERLGMAPLVEPGETLTLASVFRFTSE